MYGNNPQVQAIDLLQDLKLGVYLKIPPRHTFLAQMLGTVVGAILNYVMAISILTEQREVLLDIAGNRIWSGQNAQSYNSTAIAWGALGPQMFGSGKLTSSSPPRLVSVSFCPSHSTLPGGSFPLSGKGPGPVSRSSTRPSSASTLVTCRSESTRPSCLRWSSECSRNGSLGRGIRERSPSTT
jgi:hypothetical protein